MVVDQQRLETLQKSATLLRQALGTLGVLLLVAAGFSTDNVIRMSILAREEEMHQYWLVGATGGFIRTPLLEGAALGLLASLVAVPGPAGLMAASEQGYGGSRRIFECNSPHGLLLFPKSLDSWLYRHLDRGSGRPLGLLEHSAGATEDAGPARGSHGLR